MKKGYVFGVDANTTVLRDTSFPEDFGKETKIILNPPVNGHDAYQIVIRANEKIDAYFVEMSDLVNEKGNTLSKQNIEIYNCKYTLVKTNVEKFYGFGEGYYPNAILPMQKAVEYRENTIEKGRNQSLYFSFYIPENIPKGEYVGNFSLFIDGEKVLIPVQVNVRDVFIPRNSHLRSLFSIEWDWYGPSKDRDYSKYQRYIRLLTKYRLNVTTLIPYPQEDELEQLYKLHADLAYEYCKNPLNTTFGIPYRNWIKKRDTEGGIKGSQSEYSMGLECSVFENFLIALIRKSLEAKFDITKRGVIYFGRFIDEPQGQGTMDRLEGTNREYHEILDKLSEELMDRADELIDKYAVSKEFITDVARSVKNMPHIVTTHYHDEKYDAFIDTYCPLFWHLQPEDSFDAYAHKKEKWWYGCNGPTSPCPTYHLDDHLLSPRILSWLQYKYGYIGNLYWAVNCYDYKGAGQHEYYDFYSEIKRSGQVNLDGLLAYPGEIYGSDENVATLRMEEIRAGMEDYEVIYALGNAYEKCGVSFKKTFAYYMNFISRGIKIIAENNIFSRIRDIIFNLFELHFETGLCVCDLCGKDGNLYGRIILNDKYSLIYNGSETSGDRFNGKMTYNFSVPAASASFGIKGNGLLRSFDLGNIGEIKSISAKTLSETVSDENSDIEFVYHEGNGIRLIIPTEKGLIQSFRITVPKEIDLTAAVSLILNFDNKKDGKKYESIDIKAKFEKEDALRSMLSAETYLPPLKSSMPVYLANNDWSKSGRLEYLLISFGENSEEYRLLSESTPIKKYIWLRSAELLYKHKS